MPRSFAFSLIFLSFLSFSLAHAGLRGPSCVNPLLKPASAECSFGDLLKKLNCRGTYIGLMRQVDASIIFCENKILTADQNAAVEKNIEVLKSCFPKDKVLGQGMARKHYLEDREILYKNLLPTWQSCKTALKNDSIIREPKIGSFVQKPDGKVDLAYRYCATNSTEYASSVVDDFGAFIYNRGIHFCQLVTGHVPSSAAQSATQQSSAPSNQKKSSSSYGAKRSAQ
jgi:hypothetical protein